MAGEEGGWLGGCGDAGSSNEAVGSRQPTLKCRWREQKRRWRHSTAAAVAGGSVRGHCSPPGLLT